MPAAQQQSANVEPRVRERAEKLWRAAGRPPGGAKTYMEEAKQLIAIEDNPEAGTEPLDQGYNRPGPWGEPVEQAQVALDNEGEFPTMTDQGEQENPRALPSRPLKPAVSAHEDSHMIPDSKTEATPDLHARIRDRAYQLWVEEGRPHGRDQEHWERARRLIEEEEQGARSAPAPPGWPSTEPGPTFTAPVTAAVDPPQKTKTAAKKKRSLKSAKS
jgi:hypothetical protein